MLPSRRPFYRTACMGAVAQRRLVSWPTLIYLLWKLCVMVLILMNPGAASLVLKFDFIHQMKQLIHLSCAKQSLNFCYRLRHSMASFTTLVVCSIPVALHQTEPAIFFELPLAFNHEVVSSPYCRPPFRNNGLHPRLSLKCVSLPPSFRTRSRKDPSSPTSSPLRMEYRSELSGQDPLMMKEG